MKLVTDLTSTVSWILVNVDVVHVVKSVTPVCPRLIECTATDMMAEANRNCPMFNVNSAVPSPVAATPAIPTPGTAAYGEYFAQNQAGEATTSSQPSFKIRLSGLK